MKRYAGVSAPSSKPLTNLAASVRLSDHCSCVGGVGADASSTSPMFAEFISRPAPRHKRNLSQLVCASGGRNSQWTPAR
jgi:hypothetical protein